jgi:imidazolonepropionase-like amidohydrolase
MRRRIFLLLVAMSWVATSSGSWASGGGEDLAAARALFHANLAAIQHRDLDGYLACYLHEDSLAATGPGGLELGFDRLAEGVDGRWPDLFEARDLRLAPVRPGVVYGTYRYRVKYGDRESAGLAERLFVGTEDGWRIAVTSAFPEPPGTSPPPLALTGATLVDGTGGPPVVEAVVVVRDGHLACVGPAAGCSVPKEVDRRELTGMWVTPGLVDAHVHLSQTGWVDGRPDALDVRARYPYSRVVADLQTHSDRFFRSFLCSGVTAVFDNGGYPWTWSLQRGMGTDRPHLLAAGPLLSTLDYGLNVPAERQFVYLADEETARQAVDYLAAHRSGAAKVWYVPDEKRTVEATDAVVLAAGRRAHELGLPLIVHATGLREAKVAVRAGTHLLVHSVDDLPVDDELIQLMKEKGTAYCPTLTVPEGYLRLYEEAVAGTAPAVDDPNGCVDPSILSRVAETADIGGLLDPQQFSKGRLAAMGRQNAQRHEVMSANLLRLRDAGIPIVMGTDAGNPLTLHGPAVYAEMEAMQAAGMTPMEVLVASTAAGARVMGLESQTGTLEAGKAADLLVLAADPTQDVAAFRKVRWVMRGGELRSVEELRPSLLP